MDNAPLLTIQIAIDKAWIAVSFGISTREWYNMLKDNPPLAKGFTIIFKGQVIGGIGVSEGTSEQDMEIAEHALRVIEDDK